MKKMNKKKKVSAEVARLYLNMIVLLVQDCGIDRKEAIEMVRNHINGRKH